MAKAFKCQFCPHTVNTAQGLQSHYTQKVQCQQKLLASIIRDENHLSAEPEIHVGGVQENGVADYDEDEMQVIPDIDPPYDPPENVLPDPDIRASKRVRVEEVEDEDTPVRRIEPFPSAAGTMLGHTTTAFQDLRTSQIQDNLPPWSPFASQEEWELAQWLVKAGVTQKATDGFLKLASVSKFCEEQESD